MSVTEQTKGEVAMKDLTVGDKILTANNKYETIYSFGHRHDEVEAEYLQVKTSHSETPLELTADHMVFLSKKRAVPASMLKVGDSLLLSSSSDELVAIESIKTVKRVGAYAPFTASGTVVVNGIVASSYISMQKDSDVVVLGNFPTPLTYQWVAHVFETPHRLAYSIGYGMDGDNADGVSQWDPHGVAQWIVKQNAIVMTLIVVPSLTILSCMWMVEQYTVLSLVFLLLLVAMAVMRRKSKSPQVNYCTMV